MTDYRVAILGRMFIVLGFLFLIPCALAFQLIRINYVEGEGLRTLWSKQALSRIPIPAQRGNIYDRNGTLLVTNTVNYQIALDPKISSLTSNQISGLVKKLGEVTHSSPSFYQKKINQAPSHSEYVILAKNLNGIQKNEIQSLGIRGVIIEENFRRKYTFDHLAAHSLGFVNHNMDGRTGIEAYYNTELQGEDGVQQVRKDAFGNIFKYVGAPKKLPTEGYDLHTTIDSYIQAILEDELREGIQKHKANYGTGVIINPKTGAIIALANYPTFDPNFPGLSNSENWRNYGISDMVEPGSTFKLVTAIAAVEQRIIDFDEIFITPDSGDTLIHSQLLRDHNPLGNINFQEVIRQSSNIAIAEIAMRMDNDKFYQYARNLGFGTPSSIDIVGEESGRIPKPYNWSKVSLPWMSHGYELLATPLQIAQAYSAFANNGLLIRPYFIEKIEDSEGNIISKHKPETIRRVAKKHTLDKLLPIFESVVSDSGTGEFAQVKGLRIAGKTGTAKKVVDRKYVNQYRGSFVGFFPLEDPKYVIYIMLDDPKPVGYGGYTAAPIFQQVTKRIAGLDESIQLSNLVASNNTKKIMPNFIGLSKSEAHQITQTLQINSTIDGTSGHITNQVPSISDSLLAADNLQLTLSEDGTNNPNLKKGYQLVPNVSGMSMRNAKNLLSTLGFNVKRVGSGTVYTQFPEQDEHMKIGGTIIIRGKARSFETRTLAKMNN